MSTPAPAPKPGPPCPERAPRPPRSSRLLRIGPWLDLLAKLLAVIAAALTIWRALG